MNIDEILTNIEVGKTYKYGQLRKYLSEHTDVSLVYQGDIVSFESDEIECKITDKVSAEDYEQFHDSEIKYCYIVISM